MWILRTYFDNEMEIGTSTKFCFHDDSSIFFTVKMHHSGRFVERGKSYIEEQINYFDWCDSSNMSMTDLRSMSRQLGHEQWVKFYYNVKSHDDCSQFILLVSDDCAQDLIRNVDNEGMVNIYVDHVQPEIGFQSQGGSNLPSSQYSNVFGSEIDQTGYFADEERFEGNGVEDASDKNHQSNPVESEILEVENETESEGSDTDEEDSVYSDGFADSDYDVDDALYEQYIDKEVEWEGIGATFSPDFEVENTIRRGKSRTLSKARVAMSKKRSQLPIYKGDADNSDFEWEVGLRFKIVVEFRDAIRTYSNKQGRPLTFSKNDSNKVQVTCDCGWVIYASFQSKIDKTFQVKSIKGEHTCTRSSSSKHCTSKFLAKKYQHHIRSNPQWPATSMQEIMQMENQTDLSISKMYRTKKKALQLSHGSEMEQYSKLWNYCEELKRTNPDTTVKLKCKHVMDSGKCTFKRFYICWGALKKGFKEGCRPIIGLDGTHLKNCRGGVMLTAVGLDGNNSLYPFAYAMVRKEKYKTWEWFLELLIADLEIRNSFHYTVISDKQKGLIKAIDKLLPNSEHRFCLRHMYNNFKKDHKGLALKDMVWKAATAARIVDFKRHMEQIKIYNQAAFDWLIQRPAVNWAKSHFSTWPKSDMLLNNLCESFNSVILKARDKPIIMMLETIRLILMKRIHHQRDTILKSKGEICPKVQKILEQNKRKSREYILEWNGRDQFEVKGCHGDKMIVSLSKRTCSCKKWELTGIPCVHATACIFHRRQKVEDFVENWYTKETFLKAYTNMLNPIHGMEEWPETNTLLIEPWVAKIKKTGRPLQHARRKENDELIIEQENGKTLKKGGSKNMCSICDGIGHNKSTCNKRPQDGQSSRPSKKKSKLPVKRRVIPSNDSNLVLQPETSAQDDEVRSRASETEIFKMTSNVMTQETDGNSTMTRD